MPTPKWFYIVLAACAVVLTASEVSYRIHTWSHWVRDTDGVVFNQATGVGCVFPPMTGNDPYGCFDLVNGRELSAHPVIPLHPPETLEQRIQRVTGGTRPPAPAPTDLYSEYLREQKAAMGIYLLKELVRSVIIVLFFAVEWALWRGFKGLWAKEHKPQANPAPGRQIAEVMGYVASAGFVSLIILSVFGLLYAAFR